MCELFEVGDLFGEEVGVVQTADEVEHVFLCFYAIHTLDGALGDAHCFRQFGGSLVVGQQERGFAGQERGDAAMNAGGNREIRVFPVKLHPIFLGCEIAHLSN